MFTKAENTDREDFFLPFWVEFTGGLRIVPSTIQQDSEDSDPLGFMFYLKKNQSTTLELLFSKAPQSVLLKQPKVQHTKKKMMRQRVERVGRRWKTNWPLEQYGLRCQIFPQHWCSWVSVLGVRGGGDTTQRTVFIHMAVRKDNSIIVVCIHINPVEKKRFLYSMTVLLTILSGRCGIPDNVLRSFNVSGRHSYIQFGVSAAASEPRTQQICANSWQALQNDAEKLSFHLKYDKKHHQNSSVVHVKNAF